MTYSILVTLIALAATLFAVRAYRWGLGQRDRANTAETRATIAELEHHEAKIAARVAAALSYRCATDTEQAERQLENALTSAVDIIADLANRSLPPVPTRTADPSIPAKPWTGPAVVLTLPGAEQRARRAAK